MLNPNTSVATSFSPDATPTAKAAQVASAARDRFQDQLRAAHRDDAHLADIAATMRSAREAAAQVPSPTAGLSTLAVAGAMNSLPAALDMMRSIALRSASGELTDADRQQLHDAYAQLSAHVVTTVGSTGAGEQAQTSTRDDEREDNAQNRWREDSDDHRSTLTQTRLEPRETVQMQPVERTSVVQRQTVVEQGHGEQKDPRVDFHTHEAHVSNDDYQPTAERQSFTHPTQPASFGRIETHAETQHSFVVQAAQVTQFVQVAQTEHIAPSPEIAVV